MPPAARITDMHTCPMVTGVVPHVGGPIIKGEPTVLIGFMPAARVTDQLTCVGPPDVIVKGSATVLIGSLPAARIGDSTAHGGVIVLGCPTVMIGDAGGGGGGGGGGAGGGGNGPDDPSEQTQASDSSSGAIDPTSLAVAVIVAQNQSAAKTGAATCEICPKPQSSASSASQSTSQESSGRGSRRRGGRGMDKQEEEV